MTQEEAAELKQDLQTLQQQVAAQQEQQELHQAEAQAWQAERTQLQQQIAEAQSDMQRAQQEAAKQLQQLQSAADSHEGLMRHLSWQLEAAQQALQQQDQQQASGSDASQTVAAEGGPSSAEQQCHKVLELLAVEVQAMSQHSLVQQCITEQLLEATSNTLKILVRSIALHLCTCATYCCVCIICVHVSHMPVAANSDICMCWRRCTCAGPGWRSSRASAGGAGRLESSSSSTGAGNSRKGCASGQVRDILSSAAGFCCIVFLAPPQAGRVYRPSEL